MTRRRTSSLLALASVVGAAVVSVPDSLAAQVPDTLVADTLLADTLVADPERPAADTVFPADTLPPVELPRLTVGPPQGWATGVWVWGRDALMAARDVTLLELLQQIPGVVPLRGGDFGAPEAATAFGAGAGRVRLFWDGFEMLTLDGGVPDLALVGLGGVEEVRVERGTGELRVHVESLRAREPRPLTLVEAGTGDLATNFFSGTFLHPRVLGGILGLSLERIDTRGPFGREPGHRQGGWLSWGRALGEDFSVRLEGRSMRRDAALAAFPVGLDRTDWVARARGRVLGGAVIAEAFTGRSSVETREEPEDVEPVARSRAQHGIRVAWEPGPVRGAATLRAFGGEGLPSRSLELEGAGSLPGLGGLHGRWGVETWEGRNAAAYSLQAWTVPLLGLSGFASMSGGARGAPVFPVYTTSPPGDEEPPPGEDPPPVEEPTQPATPQLVGRFTEQTAVRLGGALRFEPLWIQVASVFLDADSLPPLGLVLDRGAPAIPGGRFRGWEAQARVDLPVRGFALVGSLQNWDRESRYLPRWIYQGAIDFHDVFLESRNLEVWGTLGVRGRDPMLVPVATPPDGEGPALARVPFQQSWYVDLQVRVLTVRLFIRWENFTLRQNLQDFPDRVLPATRALYGVRWTLWN